MPSKDQYRRLVEKYKIDDSAFAVIAICTDRATHTPHTVLLRLADSALVVKCREFAPIAVDRGVLIKLSDMHDKGELKWLYTRDRVYHCWHICFCECCRKQQGKWFAHSQENQDVHLRYVDVDDIFTFPTVDIEGKIAQEVRA